MFNVHVLRYAGNLLHAQNPQLRMTTCCNVYQRVSSVFKTSPNVFDRTPAYVYAELKEFDYFKINIPDSSTDHLLRSFCKSNVQVALPTPPLRLSTFLCTETVYQ